MLAQKSETSMKLEQIRNTPRQIKERIEDIRKATIIESIEMSRSDRDALAGDWARISGDWRAVGGDIQKAIEKYQSTENTNK